MASLTQWIWVWARSGSWWWTGKPGMLQSMGLQRIGHYWATELKCIILTTKRCVSRSQAWVQTYNTYMCICSKALLGFPLSFLAPPSLVLKLGIHSSCPLNDSITSLKAGSHLSHLNLHAEIQSNCLFCQQGSVTPLELQIVSSL